MVDTAMTPRDAQLGTQGAILAWATILAIGTNAPTVVKTTLIAQTQAFYNRTLDLIRRANPGSSPVALSEDGVWGPRTASATVALIILARTQDDDIFAAGLPAAFGLNASRGTVSVTTESAVRSRFLQLRDSVNAFSDIVAGKGGVAFVGLATGLLTVARASTTAGEIAAKTREYLLTVTSQPARSGVVAPTTVQQVIPATQTPHAAPVVVAQTNPSVTTDVELTPVEVDMVNVVADPKRPGPNLAIILPSIALGGLLLVWVAKKSRSR